MKEIESVDTTASSPSAVDDSVKLNQGDFVLAVEATASEAPNVKKPLKLKIAPHLVEDLGLNLYTTLPRVLAEFIANAYDADSPKVVIRFDHDAIADARKIAKKEQELERANSSGSPASQIVLPDHLMIVIEDYGHGMSRTDLDDKFLLAGRRRRKADLEFGDRSPGGRLVMGRKGLGLMPRERSSARFARE